MMPKTISFLYIFYFIGVVASQGNISTPNLVKVTDVTNIQAPIVTNQQKNTPVSPSNININQSYSPTSTPNNMSVNSVNSSVNSSVPTNSMSQSSSILINAQPQLTYMQNLQVYPSSPQIYPSSSSSPIYSNFPTQSTCLSQANTYWTGYRCACQVGFTNSSNCCVAPYGVQRQIYNKLGYPIYLRHRKHNLDRNEDESSQSESSQQNNQERCPLNSVWNGQICIKKVDKELPSFKISGSNNDFNQTNKNNNSNTKIDQANRINSSNNSQKISSQQTDKTNQHNQKGNQSSTNMTIASGKSSIPNFDKNSSTIVQTLKKQLSCQQGQIYRNGKCVNITQLVKVKNITVAGCPQGQYLDNNFKCIDICPNKFIFNAVTQNCQCPAGLVPLNSDCVQCPNSTFYVKGVCIACPFNSQFDNATSFCVCNTNFKMQNGSCVQITITQTTTTSSVVDTKTSPSTKIQTTNSNNSTNQNIELYGNISMNNNNVMVVLKTYKQFKFSSNSDMQNFMKTKFNSSQTTPSVYCNQDTSNLSLFDCLLIYPSGVPNNAFSVQFYYDYNNQKGSTTVNIDTFKAQSSLRSNLR